MERRLVRWGNAVVLVGGLLAATSDARAQDGAPPPSESGSGAASASTSTPTTDAAPPADGAQGDDRGFMTTSHAGADLYWYSAKLIGSTFALVPTATIGVTDKIFIDAWLPVGLNVGSSSDKTYFGLGNPTVGAHYGVVSGPTSLYVGGRAGIPLVHIMDDRDAQVATSAAGISMALYDNHLWVAYLPIGAFAGVEHVATEIFRVRGELAPTILVPFKSRDTEVQYQLRGEGEARHESGFGGGLGLQAIHVVTSRGDNVQVAGEPFVGFDNRSIYARLGLLLALDEPLGFGFDEGLFKVATARFRMGAYW